MKQTAADTAVGAAADIIGGKSINETVDERLAEARAQVSDALRSSRQRKKTKRPPSPLVADTSPPPKQRKAKRKNVKYKPGQKTKTNLLD